jgi:Carboxypeptidase regulatory-like domain
MALAHCAHEECRCSDVVVKVLTEGTKSPCRALRTARSPWSASKPACVTLLVLWILVFPSPGLTQTGNQASIDGLAKDQSGAVITDAHISVRQLETGASFTTLTNEEGLFRFPVLPVGRYEVRAEHAGFTTLVFERI